MSRWMWLVVLAITSLVLTSVTVTAEEALNQDTTFEWAPITEADWQAGTDTLVGAKSAVMIFEKIRVDDRWCRKGEEDQKSERGLTIYRRIRILGDAGRVWADIDVPAELEAENQVAVFGRTVLRGGEESQLKAENIRRETVVKAGGEEWIQTRFSMPNVIGDCIIEYALKYSTVPFRSWTIQKDIPLLHGEYRWYYSVMGGDIEAFLRSIFGYNALINTRNRPEYLWRNLPSKPPLGFPYTKDSTELLFQVDSIPAVESEPATLPDRALRGELLCYYGSGTLDIEYWSSLTASLARWFGDYFCSKTTKMKKVLAGISGSTVEERAYAAYDWIQANIKNTTYIDLNKVSGKKGVAAGHTVKEKTNETADDVIKRGYGTDKNVVFLYCAMLRELELDSRLALVVDRNKNIFERRIHDWQFDHSLVAVYDSAGKVRFFSPGVPYMPYGMVPWFNEGVTALVEGTQGTMITVPPADPDLTEETEVYTLAVSPDAKTTGTVQARLTGHAAASVRGNILYVDSSEYAESLKDAVSDFLPDGTIDSLVCGAVADINSPLAVTCHVEFPPVEAAGDKILFKPMDYFVTRQNPFISTKRQTPIAFGYAYHRREAAQINIPEGWVVEALPSDSLFSNRVGNCGVQFTQIGNMLSVQRIFKLNAPIWQVADYKDVRVLFQAREDMGELIVVLKKDAGATKKP
jgi:hypothetical protein